MSWPYTAAYHRARDALLATHPLCIHCGLVEAGEADHYPPLVLHEHVEGTACCVLLPSCRSCAAKQGGAIAEALRAGLNASVEVVEPEGFEPDDPVWDVAWLDEFREVPEEATWPRYMSAPHALAVGTLGPEFCEWVDARTPKPLRWWQRLVAYRLLEVDADGRLVWEALVLTLARQVGKSWLLRELCMWRLYQAERFGEDQLIMHTGRDLAVCIEVQRPARNAAKSDDTLKAREANGNVSIERLACGSRWLVKAKDATYGYPVSLGVVDEAWDVPALSIEEGMYPTLVEREQSQIVLVSSAHRRATALIVNRRAAALAVLANPLRDLFIEWSTPRSLQLDSEEGWRLASPYWSGRRRNMVAARLQAALTGTSDDPEEADPLEAFRSQWLNQWPITTAAPQVDPGEALLAAGVWQGLIEDVDAVGPLVLAVEDFFGQGAAACAAGRASDGRIVVGGWTFRNRGEAFAWASFWATRAEGSRLLVGASLMGDRTLDSMPVADISPMAQNKSAAALSLLRELASARQIVHDGSPDLSEQVERARVKTLRSGLSLLSGSRADLLRCVLWATEAVEHGQLVPAVH